MKPLKIVLGDFSYFNKFAQNRLFVPLSIGYIATYAKQLFGPQVEISLFKDPQLFLDHIKVARPDLVGLSLYYWNTNLNYLVVERIRRMYGDKVFIVCGGPSVDTDPAEQQRMFSRFPLIDALIPNEGELGFSNVIERMLSTAAIWQEPINGVVFRQERGADQPALIQGQQIGLSLDLSKLRSPYLEGVLDPFLKGAFQPLIQTSRMCPYQCSYCVSGKNRGKLRTFPLEQVKEEMAFVSKMFKDRPYYILHVCDDNFGVFPNDVEKADQLKKCSLEIGYPKKVEFYPSKKISDRSKNIVEKIGDISFFGLPISMQSDNPTTLNAIGRKNLSEEEVNSAIEWASSRNVSTSTECIFGLPHETKDSFLKLLDKCIEQGFDLIQCYNLILVDGSEVNRKVSREKYGIRTMFRIPSSYYGMVDDQFVCEAEEIAVESNSFSFDDFIAVRCVNFMFHVVFSLNFYKWFFHFIRQQGISVVQFFDRFMNPDPQEDWPQEYMDFISDLKARFVEELSETRDELRQRTEALYKDNDCEVKEPARINLFFASRLIYMEGAWVKEVLKRQLRKFCPDQIPEEDLNMILDVCGAEWVDLSGSTTPGPITVKKDILKWKAGKFRIPLKNEQIPERQMNFSLKDEVKARMNLFSKEFGKLLEGGRPNEYYYSAMDFIFPRTKLMYDLGYDSKIADADPRGRKNENLHTAA